MNQKKLMSFSTNPDGIGKEKLDPRAQIAAVLLTDIDRTYSGKRAPRGRTAKRMALRYGATKPRAHGWGNKARNPSERK